MQGKTYLSSVLSFTDGKMTMFPHSFDERSKNVGFTQYWDYNGTIKKQGFVPGHSGGEGHPSNEYKIVSVNSCIGALGSPLGTGLK